MSETPGLAPDEPAPTHLPGEGKDAVGNGAADGGGGGNGERRTNVVHDGATGDGNGGSQVCQTVMFTDIENSVSLTGMLGQNRWAEVLARHGQLFREALGQTRVEAIENTGDGFMVRFEETTEAVGVALRFQWLLRREKWQMEHALRVRVGIHRGEMLLVRGEEREMPKAVGVAVSLTARVMGMADGGQMLLTREAFDEARQSIAAVPGFPEKEQGKLGWEAHGAYFLKGVEGAQEVFEVGERGYAPFRRPRDGANAERSRSSEEKTTLGWRPAAEMEVPKRPDWRLVRKLGQGGFGEVWLGEYRAKNEKRVFKFCFDVVKLRSFQRELKLFQFIRQSLGPRTDIATLYDVQLESSPYFLESAYCNGGTLDEWLARKLREGEVPLAQRLAIMATVARALAAAHSVGIIHKDVKPSNIFIDELADGTVQPRLADFGIGELANRAAMEGTDPNNTGIWAFTLEQMHSGTQMYCPPEYIGSSQASVLGDIYSFGVVLYQVATADFHRLIVGDGWRREVPDEMLAGDIAACVDVRPELRLSSAALVADRLETLEQRRADLAAKEAEVRNKQELEKRMLAQRAKTRRARIWAGGALAAVAILIAIAFILIHSRNTVTAQREQARDQVYRADMAEAIASIDNWRGEAARSLVNEHKPNAGERDRRGWEWYLADSALNAVPQTQQVSKEALRALAVSPDEKSAAVGGDDGEISIWSCDPLEKVDSWHEKVPVRSLAWKDEILAIGLENGEVTLRDVKAKREQRRWKAHAGAVQAMKWHPERDELTTGGAEGAIERWPGNGGPSAKLFDMKSPVLSIDWRADGQQIAVVLGNPTRLLAGPPGELNHGYPMDVPDSAVAWRPGKNEVAVSMKDKPMRSFNPTLPSEDKFYLTSRYFTGVSAFAWAPNGLRIAVGGIDGKILVAMGQEDEYLLPLVKEIRPVLYGHTRRITGLHWLKGDRLLSISADGTLRRWDDLQRPLHLMPTRFPAPVADVQWHPDESLLAVLVGGEEIQILDGSRRLVWMRPMPPAIRGHVPFDGGRVAWSPDGKWIAATCLERGLVVWRFEGGDPLLPSDLTDALEIQWLTDSRGLLVRTPRAWFRVGVSGEPPERVADPDTVWINDLPGGLFGRIVNVAGKPHFIVGPLNGPASMDVPLPEELEGIRTCVLNAKRTRLAVGGETGVLIWLDTHDGKATSASPKPSNAIQAIGWHPDGTRLVATNSDRICQVYDVALAAQTVVLAHQLELDVGSVSWSADGQRLVLASSSGAEFWTYEIPPADKPATVSISKLFTEIEDHPDEGAGWEALAQALQGAKGPQAEVLRSAAQLGLQARFVPLGFAGLGNAPPVSEWEGEPLPRAVQVAQACALEHWEEVVALCDGNQKAGTAHWFAVAKGEALTRLGRKKDAEAVNLQAWRALRRHDGARDFSAIPDITGAGSSTIDLNSWATAHPSDDWVPEDTGGSENNNLIDLEPLIRAQPDGVVFKTGDFVLLAGKTLRLTTRRMLPRSTGWIPLNTASKQISCVVAACNCMRPEYSADICVGSIFLLRQDGGAVRVPLVYGQNIWRWWVPDPPQHWDAPDDAVAWEGTNQRVPHFHQKLRLYRLNWTAQPGESPVVAISMVSTMRQPAPLLMSVDARP